MAEQFSFYLEKNNNLFQSDVLAICYRASKEEVEDYGLTSDNIILFIKHENLSKIPEKKDFDYLKKIKDIFEDKEIILRIQSECLLGMYGDSHCDCEEQRLKAIKIISERNGMFIHLPQEAQGWGLHYKLKELELQVSGRKVTGEFIGEKNRDEAQKILLNTDSFVDHRSYKIVCTILEKLSLSDCRYILITDSDQKIKSLEQEGMNVIKYTDYIIQDVNVENTSEYLVKIYNLTHDFSEETIDKIINIINSRKYTERTLSVLLNIIERIKNDNDYKLPEHIKNKFLDLYNDIICGKERTYIRGDEKYIRIQNNFSCRVNSTIFKTISQIYGKNIFDRVSVENIYYFKNKEDDRIVRIRSSYIVDCIDEICKMFKNQTYLELSTYDSKNSKVYQQEVSISKLRSFFENPQYDYIKRTEMLTIISEDVIPGLNIYIKRLPSIENRIMDVFGKKDVIQDFINRVIDINGCALLSTINDQELSEQNFSKYNLSFADFNSVIEEEQSIYELTKEVVEDGVRSKILLPKKIIR